MINEHSENNNAYNCPYNVDILNRKKDIIKSCNITVRIINHSGAVLNVVSSIWESEEGRIIINIPLLICFSVLYILYACYIRQIN